MREKCIGTTTLEDLLPHVRQEPWGRRSKDGTANAPPVIDREEPDSFRLEVPSLAIGAACCIERHRDPDAIGGELVRDRLSKRFGPSMHFHFSRRHARFPRVAVTPPSPPIRQSAPRRKQMAGSESKPGTT